MQYEEKIYQSDSELPQDLKLQILSFLRYDAPEGFVGENECRDWINSPDDRSSHIVITTNNGILISYCGVVRKQLHHAQNQYTCWGLTGVLTYPAFRHRGFGKRIVGLGTELIVKSSADIGMFNCSRYLRDFYVANGWIFMEKSTTLVGNKDKPLISKEVLMMMFLSDKGKTGRADFENIPIYFGEYTW